MKKNRVRLFIFIIIMALMNLFYYNYLFFAMLCLSVMMPVISISLTKYMVKNIETEIEFDKNFIEKDIEASVKLKVVNRSFFPIVNMNVRVVLDNIFYGENVLDKNIFKETHKNLMINVPVEIKGVSNVNFGIKSTYSGIVTASVKEYYVQDFIGIYAFKVKNKEEKCGRLFVLPKINDINNDENKVSDIGNDNILNSKKIEDISEIIDIREYREGDRLQKIHWKLTQKQDQIMVKEYAQVNEERIIVFVELEYKNADKALDKFYSLANLFLKNDILFVVRWFSYKTGEVEGFEVQDENSLDTAVELIFETGCYNKEMTPDNAKITLEEGVIYVHG